MSKGKYDMDDDDSKKGGNRYSLVYGLCKEVGIDTTGMTPRQAWEALEKARGKTKEEIEKEHWDKVKKREDEKRENLARKVEGRAPKRVDNDEEIDKAELEKGIAELEKAGVKFTREDVIFVTHDRTGQLIWLEKGREKAGLQHIIEHHTIDFYNKLGVFESEISKTIRNIITEGTVEHQRITIHNSNEGYEKIYKYRNKYYFFACIGLNGFITTIFPKHDSDALDLIRRYKDEKENN